MLRIVPQTSAAAAKRYYQTADYYSQGQETVGLWGGRGAERLGLCGQVDRDAFEALCDNLHPDLSGRSLTARTNLRRRVGYDFNFSVSKSVSLAYGLTKDPELLAAFRGAVRETMEEIEQDMRVRVRKNDANHDRQTGNMLWAEYIHTTSRPVDETPPDPHLHAHIFAINATWDPEEQGWKAGEFGAIKRDGAYYQAAFRARLAEKLVQQGWELAFAKGDFEIVGLKPAARKFQRRTDHIEAEAQRRGLTSDKQKDGLGAKTRQKKVPELSEAQLQHAWWQRLEADDRLALDRACARVGSRVMAREDSQAVDFAARHLFERESVVSEHKLLAEALRHGIGAVTVEGVHAALAKAGLMAGERDGQRHWTSPELWGMEQGIIRYGRDTRGTCRPLGPARRAFTRDWLNRQQKKAVRFIYDSCSAVTVLRGAPGVGKTTLLQEAREGIEANGYRFFAFAPSTDAVQTLRDDGFTGAQTLQELLVNEKMQQQVRGQVVLVDEAGLVGTRTMAELFTLAQKLDLRLILSGDDKQHAPVEAGSPLRLLETRAGLPFAEVTQIERQKDVPRYKEAVAAIRRGQTDTALDTLADLGWVQEIADAGEREQRLAEDYLQAVARRKKNGDPVTALVIAPTHAEGERIQNSIRAELKARGTITGPEREVLRLDGTGWTKAERGDATNYAAGDVVRFFKAAPGFARGQCVTVLGHDDLGHVRVETADGQTKALPLHHAGRFEVFHAMTLPLAVGDRVRITHNGRSKDGEHKLGNGSFRVVDHFTRGGIVFDNGMEVAADFGFLAPGYTVTSHASQSKTVDEVFIGQSELSFPASSREQLLVSLSRGRTRAVIYTDDKHALREAVRRSDERLTATELVGEESRRRKGLMEHVTQMWRWLSMRPRQASPPGGAPYRQPQPLAPRRQGRWAGLAPARSPLEPPSRHAERHMPRQREQNLERPSEQYVDRQGNDKGREYGR